MKIWNDAGRKPLEAGSREAARLGSTAFGSEHLLLGLLEQADSGTAQLIAAHPALTLDRMRGAVHDAIDDLPALTALGLSPDQLHRLPTQDPDALAAARQINFTAEFMDATNSAGKKYLQLAKGGALVKMHVEPVTTWWLVVLEPGTRSARLLRICGTDPDELRVLVLRQLSTTHEDVSWPDTAPRGPLLTRLTERVMQRFAVERH